MHLDALGGEVGGQLLGGVEDRVVLARGDDVHVGRRHGARPAQAHRVEGVLRDRGDGARGADAVGAHRDGDELAVLVEHLEAEGVGELAAELEDVAHLDPARGLEDAVAARAGVAGAHLGGLDRAVGGEVAAHDEVERVAAGLVGAGHPAGALHDARVDEEADAGRALLPQHAGADVALHEVGVLRRSPPRRRAGTRRGRASPRAAWGRPRGRRARRSPAARWCRRAG